MGLDIHLNLVPQIIILSRSLSFFLFILWGYKPVSTAGPAALGFIISPWSLLLLPSGSVSFTDENISNQDLRAFTAPEVLQSQSLTSLSDVEKVTVPSFLLGKNAFNLK